MTAPVWYVFGLWLCWFSMFVFFRPKKKGEAVQTAKAARWGILFQTIGFWLVFIPARTAWGEPLVLWRLVSGILFGILGILLAGTGISHLGKQWRVNAALNSDHELITTGPYHFVRHPIYASMFAMEMMGVFMVGKLPWWPLAIILFIVGIEIRVRVEDGLLRGRFGSRFEEWKSRVPAYLPPIR